jgi:beta-lactamase class D
MRRYILCLLMLTASSVCRAETVCTLIYAEQTDAILREQGDCDKPYSPASTFKIPLSLMGYDSGYFSDTQLPELPFHEGYPAVIPSHQHATNPAYWMKNSVVWYSQTLTEWLGMQRFNGYIQAFAYGNQDLSGDAGKNNGLVRSWLSSSLKITPRQQLQFLQKLLDKQLPVSDSAYLYTKQILRQDNLINDYAVYGKTGTGTPLDNSGSKQEDRQFGWFIGWAEHQGKQIIFVHLVNELVQKDKFASQQAKAEIFNLLPELLTDIEN